MGPLLTNKTMKIFNEEEISRVPDLDKNDGLLIYDNRACQQNIEAFKLFPELLDRIRPKKILEIGTGLGGLIHYIKTICNKIGFDVEIISYDIHERREYEDLKESGIDVRVENVFNENYSELMNPSVIDFISGAGRSLVLCDGGYKPGEFNLLAKYLKPGDIIMAHDYAKNREYFEKEVNGKFWNWHEISDKDIEDTCDLYDLKFFMQDSFNEAVWVCKIKDNEFVRED